MSAMSVLRSRTAARRHSRRHCQQASQPAPRCCSSRRLLLRLPSQSTTMKCIETWMTCHGHSTHSRHTVSVRVTYILNHSHIAFKSSISPKSAIKFVDFLFLVFSSFTRHAIVKPATHYNVGDYVGPDPLIVLNVLLQTHCWITGKGQ